jgi:UDP-2,4-diacetamido-2,4,6-trideoxy-beta-L-altropyranose hydrolase
MHNTEKRQTIIFRADGGAVIGMGHFIRTLALAEMLKEDFHCIYATRSPGKYQIREIEKVCQENLSLPDDDTHFHIFLNLLKGNEIVVLDNYFFTTGYQKAIKEKGCKLVCIDDLHDKEFYADLIINHSPGVKEEDYKAQAYTKFALGLKYALIRQAFYRTTQARRKTEKLETVFISFGGSDPFNLTLTTLNILLDYEYFKRIIVVTGDRYPHGIQFVNIKKMHTGVEFYQAIDAEMMARMMSESDLAIIPSAGTLLEAMKTGLAVITGYYVPNQETMEKNIHESGLTLSCENMLINYQTNLKKLLDSLSINDVNRMITKQKTVFSDNKGTYIKLMQKLANS